MSPTPSNLMCFLFPVSGVRWSNINESIDNSSMGQVLLMLLVDTLIFALLAWYLDKVGSGRVGEHPGPTTGKGGKQHITISCQQVSASKPKSKNCVFSMIGGK